MIIHNLVLMKIITLALGYCTYTVGRVMGSPMMKLWFLNIVHVNIRLQFMYKNMFSSEMFESEFVWCKNGLNCQR